MSFFHRQKDITSAYDNYADLLYRLAFSHLGNDFDAQDAVSETFMRYLRHLPEFRSDEHEKAWLIRVLTNVSYDMLRHKKVRAYTPIEEVNISVYEKGFNEEESVFDKLSKISPKNKAVVILHYLEGYSVKEIGKIFGISESAVKMRLMRGRDELKTHLDKED